MTATDQHKIINKGFKVIRREYNRMLIKIKIESSHGWSNLESGFPSKAALDRRMKEMLADPMTVED